MSHVTRGRDFAIKNKVNVYLPKQTCQPQITMFGSDGSLPVLRPETEQLLWSEDATTKFAHFPGPMQIHQSFSLICGFDTQTCMGQERATVGL